eukprot:sb/3472832/
MHGIGTARQTITDYNINKSRNFNDKSDHQFQTRVNDTNPAWRRQPRFDSDNSLISGRRRQTEQTLGDIDTWCDPHMCGDRTRWLCRQNKPKSPFKTLGVGFDNDCQNVLPTFKINRAVEKRKYFVSYTYSYRPTQVKTNQTSLFRSRDWLSANQGPVFPD